MSTRANRFKNGMTMEEVLKLRTLPKSKTKNDGERPGQKGTDSYFKRFLKDWKKK